MCDRVIRAWRWFIAAQTPSRELHRNVGEAIAAAERLRASLERFSRDTRERTQNLKTLMEGECQCP